MIDILSREFTYLWYYFTVQFEQIFGYWVLGIVLGSVISVFGKQRIHQLFGTLQNKRLGAFGVIPASAIGIASPLCRYGTIPIAASFSEKGMKDDWLAAFMMSSILLNPQWETIEPLLPEQGKHDGRPRHDDRRIINAIPWILGTGAPWRDLPKTYRKWHTVYNRFRLWIERGVWEKSIQHRHSECRARFQRGVCRDHQSRFHHL